MNLLTICSFIEGSLDLHYYVSKHSQRSGMYAHFELLFFLLHFGLFATACEVKNVELEILVLSHRISAILDQCLAAATVAASVLHFLLTQIRKSVSEMFYPPLLDLWGIPFTPYKLSPVCASETNHSFIAVMLCCSFLYCPPRVLVSHDTAVHLFACAVQCKTLSTLIRITCTLNSTSSATQFSAILTAEACWKQE